MKETEVDLNGILTLLTIIRTGSFSAAARHLGVPVNRLSRQVQRLEEKLGVRLLQRSTRKLSLTTIGRSLLEHAEPALVELESWWQHIQAQADEPSGHLRISTFSDSLSTIFVSYIAQFMERYPSINLELILSDEQIDFFATGIDVAFRAGPIQDENLIARKLLSSRLLVVASPRLLEQYTMPSNISELINYPCLAAHGQDGWATWTLNNGQQLESVRVPVRLAMNGLGALLAATKAGLGIALLPDHLVASELASGTLINLLPSYDYDGGGLYLVYPTRKHPPAALRVFLDFVIDVAETLPEGLNILQINK
ncbi:LysR family transcriptional regulator [Acinetobacter courvalinii]|uniref:LysR family transcriptional regulator n=1 Tax=Acinetobacter courvalinii TaxID=280147 RepID=UPI0002D05057|nr:LysR family transcriptional regulator [Acinetobacter courvalinii]ENX05713.1 hypothetical protein F898_02657 [Acinetobacter courvalinii]